MKHHDGVQGAVDVVTDLTVSCAVTARMPLRVIQSLATVDVGWAGLDHAVILSSVSKRFVVFVVIVVAQHLFSYSYLLTYLLTYLQLSRLRKVTAAGLSYLTL